MREDRTLRIGAYNLDNGRNRDQVAAEVRQARALYDVELLFVQEGAGYWRRLRKGGTLDVLLPKAHGRPARDTYLLADPGVGARHRHAHRMEQGWERAPGRSGLHPPRVLNVYQADWLDRAASVHFPPTPRSQKRPEIQKAYPLRDLAWAEYADELGDLVDGWNRAGLRWVAAGDWNISAADPRIREWAELHGGTIKGRGIDYFILGPGVAGWNFQHQEHGKGDHGHIALLDVRPIKEK